MPYFSDSTTNLGASATFTSTARDAAERFNLFRVMGNCNENGTLAVEQSDDNSTWVETSSTSTTGGTASVVEEKIVMEFVRFKFTNDGASETTTLQLNSRLLE